MSGRAATTSIIEGKCALSVGDPGTPVPEGWTRVPLLSIAELGTGHTPSRSRPEYWDGGVPWIAIPDARDNHTSVITETSETVSQLGLENSAARILPSNTVGLSRTASVGYVFIMGRPMATSQDFVTWTCSEALDPRFLMYALLAEGDDIRKFGKGSTHTTIYFPEVKAFNLTLAPKPEQRRIVAKLDSLRARSSRARQELDHIPKLIERYKQAILAKTFSEIPRDRFRTLRELTDLVTSGSRGWAKYYSEAGATFVRVGNVRRNAVDLDLADLQHVSPPESAEGVRTSLMPNDIVITITADLGRVGIIPSNLQEAYVNQHVALVRLKVARSATSIAWYLSSPAGQASLLEKDRGVTRSGLGLDDIRAVAVPDLSVSESEEVVRKINSSFKWLDKIATEHARAEHLLPKLDQAILAKAFRGRLVPQDPNDEPASELLQRIKTDVRGGASGKRR